MHRNLRLTVVGVTATALTLAAAGCGSSTTNTASPGSTTAGSAAPTSKTNGSTPAGAYVVGSDVTAHAAIGEDFAKIKTEIAKAKDGNPVDWKLVQETFTKGGASKKSDGSTRTLEKLVDEPAVVAYVESAMKGPGEDKVRAQHVEKGISSLIHLKVIDELRAAAAKVDKGETDPKTGAPHNVDEAWAFYTAGGNGTQSTAKKRGDDFKKDVDGPTLAALTAAQVAAGQKDAAAFAKAEDVAIGALNYTFYLATYKYLATDKDPIKQAEGESFFLAIEDTVKKADPAAAAAITAAFKSGDSAAGRTALNDPKVLTALKIPAANAITS